MGLREHKKQQTVAALRTAALRLALDRGPENVRVDDIAAAAGVSPRTYNNYFSSREQAIVSAVIAERESRVAAAILARPAQVRLSDAVIDAVVEQYADPGGLAPEVLVMITTSPALRSSYAETVAMAGDALTEAIIERTDGIDRLTAHVLSASVGAAAKLALTDWLGGAPPANGFVVPSGSLADRMRGALLPLAPALDAAVRDRLEG
jgi:AcrR family transcriptional regulator